MGKIVIRLLYMQLGTACCVAIPFAVMYGSKAAVASVFGGLVAIMMTLMLAWRIGQAARSSHAMGWLLIGAAERAIAVCIAFAVGMGALGLAPVPLLIAFAAAELAYYMAAGPVRRYMLELMGRRYDGQ
jgi:ATP synthase protein I